MGEVVEVGRVNKKLEGRGPRRGALYHLLRRVPLLPEWLLLGMRTQQSEQEGRGTALGPFTGGVVRLFPPAGRLSRRIGGVHPRPLCRRRTDQGAGRSERRTGSLPLGHLPDRLHGGRFLQALPSKRARRISTNSVEVVGRLMSASAP